MPVPPASSSKTEANRAFTRLRWVLGAALLAMLGGGGALLGSGGTAAVAEVLQDPLSLFADRSPGSRPDGALYSTKHAKSKPASPVELVLAQERTRPPLPSEEAAPDSILAPALDQLVAPSPIDLLLPGGAPVDALPGPSGGPIFGGGTPGIFVPIGELPGSPGSPSTPPGCCTPGTPSEPTDPVVPAVPEPATWLMLILGFFMVGGSLRAKAKRTVSVHAA